LGTHQGGRLNYEPNGERRDDRGQVETKNQNHGYRRHDQATEHAGKDAGPHSPVLPLHHARGYKSRQRHHIGNRQIDIAIATRDYEHLADAHDHEEDSYDRRRRESIVRAAERNGKRDQPGGVIQFWDTSFRLRNRVALNEHECILKAPVAGKTEEAATHLDRHLINAKHGVLADLFDITTSSASGT